MRRRRFIKTTGGVGSIVGLAGCLGFGDSDGSDTTDRPAGTTSTAPPSDQTEGNQGATATDSSNTTTTLIEFEEAWTYSEGRPQWPTDISNGTVYFIVHGDRPRSDLVAVGTESGTQQWENQISEDYSHGLLFAVTDAGIITGNTMWSVSDGSKIGGLSDSIKGEPQVVADGSLYTRVALESGSFLTKYDLTTGSEEWQTASSPRGSWARREYSMSERGIHNLTVTEDGQYQLVTRNPENGEIKYTSSISVSNPGLLGSTDRTVIAIGGRASERSYRIQGLEASSGTKRWEQTLDVARVWSIATDLGQAWTMASDVVTFPTSERVSDSESDPEFAFFVRAHETASGDLLWNKRIPDVNLGPDDFRLNMVGGPKNVYFAQISGNAVKTFGLNHDTGTITVEESVYATSATGDKIVGLAGSGISPLRQV